MDQAALVRLAMLGRDDQLAHALPGGVFERPAEDAGGDVVPGRHRPVHPHDHDRVERRFQNRVEIGMLQVAGDAHGSVLAARRRKVECLT